ncbi:hypothetical protein Lal_00036913 [Lupinus albus]|nr:hypothetical protein Lal_00036913 [Lupinus albus]
MSTGMQYSCPSGPFAIPNVRPTKVDGHNNGNKRPLETNFKTVLGQQILIRESDVLSRGIAKLVAHRKLKTITRPKDRIVLKIAKWKGFSLSIMGGVELALARIKGATTLSGNTTSLRVSPSLHDFSILKSLKVVINYKKALHITEVIWKFPSLGIVKINTDGAALGAPSQAGDGAIFRDQEGNFTGCFASYYDIQDALYAKLKYVILVIELAKNFGWNSIWLECNSTNVMNIFL